MNLEKLSLEEALERLDDVIENLQNQEVSLEESIPKREVGFLYHHSTLKDNPAVEGFISYIKEHVTIQSQEN